MLAQNRSGWILLEYFKISESEIVNYDNVSGAFAIMSIDNKYLIGFNRWRQQWEFPAGGIEEGETAREAAARELFEETHQRNNKLQFRGLFKMKDNHGNIKYQAVYLCFQEKLIPFVKTADDEMEKIMLWDLKQDIGYVDECDLAVVKLSCI